MSDLHAVELSEPERDAKAHKTRDERQQIVFLAGADHALEELLAVENADSVKEHDQAGEADRANDLGFRREGANGKADEKHGADAKGEAEDVDLANQVADADGEKRRQDRLAADDVASKIQHCPPPGIPKLSTGVAARVAKLADDPAHQFAGGRRRIVVLVVEAHRLPLELTHLMEGLHLDPFDVLHGRDKF